MAVLHDGRPCATAASDFLPGEMTLCCRHHQRLVRYVLDMERERAEHERRDMAAASDRARKLERVKPVLRRDADGWAFDLNLPAIGADPRRRIRRRGFKTKRDARWEAQQVLDSLLLPLRRGAEEFTLAIQNEQRRAAEEWARREEDKRATSLALHGSIIRARREREQGRSVYYVRRPGGAIKIGTTWNLRSRMQAFRNATPIELLAHHSGGQVAEAALHWQFKHLRLDGEWFQPGPDLLAHIRHVIEVSGRRQGQMAGGRLMVDLEEVDALVEQPQAAPPLGRLRSASGQ